MNEIKSISQRKVDIVNLLKTITLTSASVLVILTISIYSLVKIINLHGFHEYVDIYHKKLHSSYEVDRNPIYISDVVLIKMFGKYGVIEDFTPDTVSVLYEDNSGVLKSVTLEKEMVVKVDKSKLLNSNKK